MKKTFPANINGSIFYIDEDAYELLNNYLNQLSLAFPRQEGKEIISDIEARIAELLNDMMSSNSRVVTLNDINAIIEQMGKPSDLTEDSEDSVIPENSNANTTSGKNEDTTPPPFSNPAPAAPACKRLYRDERNKVFGGVISGLATYLGWNVSIMRLLCVVLCVCSYVWPMTVIYLVAWMVIPPARTPRQILEMTGTPVTINNVGQTILGTSEANAANGSQDLIQTIFSSIGKIILAVLGFVGIGAGIGGLIILLIAISGIIAYTGWNSIEILDTLDIYDAYEHPTLGATGAICMGLAMLIPGIGLAWAACTAIFKAHGASKPIIISAVVIEILLIVAATVLLSLANVSTTHEYIVNWQPY